MPIIADKNNAAIQVETQVRPFTRQGILVSFERLLNSEQLSSLCHMSMDSWSTWQTEYKDSILKLDNLKKYNIEVAANETPLTHKEPDNQCVDFPRFDFFLDDNIVFSTRLCLAICIRGGSSKFWSRIGLPPLTQSTKGYSIPIQQIQEHTAKSQIPMKELREYISLYRLITQKSSNWIFEKFKEIIKSQVLELKTLNLNKEVDWMEISAFGVNDVNVLKYTNQLSHNKTTLKEILKDSKANDILSYYFREASDIQCSLNEYISREDTQSYAWFISPTFITNGRGYIQQRNVLYLMRRIEGKTQIIGVGYDDSGDGQLAHASVTKVAIWCGSKV